MYNEYGKQYTYYVVETTESASGYIVTYIGQNNGLHNGDSVTITNTSGTALPATGGPGTLLMYGLGAVVAEIAGYNILSKRRKMRSRNRKHKMMKKRWS